jgi:hypothetical protein
MDPKRCAHKSATYVEPPKLAAGEVPTDRLARLVACRAVREQSCLLAGQEWSVEHNVVLLVPVRGGAGLAGDLQREYQRLEKPSDHPRSESLRSAIPFCSKAVNPS